MTTQTAPRPEPDGSRPRTTGGQLRPEAAGGTSRRLAMTALALSIAGVAIAAWAVFAPGAANCQAEAWDTTPAAADLPAGWSLASSQYDVARKSMSLLGSLPADETVSQAVVYATVTCYQHGAADAVTRSADAATAAGQFVTDRDDLGDQGFSAADDSGATFLQFRHDRLVVYLAASGDATATEVDELASAFDLALGGDGGAVTVGAPVPATAVPSDDAAAPGASDDIPPEVAAPELEAALPTVVGDIVMTVDSATGSMMLGEDPVSRAITAALRADGRVPDDLGVAQAYDETAESDLTITAIAVDGMSGDKVLPFVMESWLAATGAGIARE
ncbi:MAG: hypothetical protein MUQ32_02970, partial [Chloroflexi bacterium]|nr:hypothetical protein [Chloroflexota bacterium]